MTSTEVKQFVIDNHKEMTITEMAEATNSSYDRVYYHVVALGLLSKPPKMSNEREIIQTGEFFNVNAIPSGTTWIV